MPAHEMRALRRVLGAVTHLPGVDAAAQAALGAVIDATGATIGSIWLFRPDGAPFRAAQLGLTREYLEAQASVPDWDPNQLAVVSLPDVALYGGKRPGGDLPRMDRRLHLILGIRGMAVLPLRVAGVHLGAALIGHPEGDWFERYSADFLRTLAEVIANSLECARRYSELRGGSALLEGGDGSSPESHTPVEMVLDHSSQMLLAEMLFSLDSGVALVRGAEALIIEHNPAFAQLVAQDASARLHGRRLDELVQGERRDRLRTLVQDTLGVGQSQRVVQLPAAPESGDATTWSVTAAPIAGPGSPSEARLVLALTDITERVTLEERLRQAHRMQAVGTLAGGIAHEFNNLLTAILGNVSLSLLDLPATHPLVPGLRDSQAAAMRAAELTRQLLGFGRPSPASLRPIDLARVVEDTVSRLERSLGPRIRFEYDIPTTPLPVLADTVMVEQLISHLCLNANDAMPSGGVLCTRLALASQPREVLGRRGEFVCLEIQDTGEGIEPELMARIYDPFFTTKGPDRGTGLGLALVHGIVEQHSGWIECESAPGQGTCFRVFLPCTAALTVSQAPAMGRGEIILVVEDEDALRVLAHSVLERLGYRVLVAEDGLEAVELVARGTPVDLVLLDQTMPRLSGLDTLQRLRAIDPRLPVVLTSGYELGVHPLGSAGLVVEGFLSKPYTPDSLGTAVREALDSRG